MFIQSDRLSRFLRFTVEATPAGEADMLKEYLIGTEAYDRKPPYHPNTDSIVRSEALRLPALLLTSSSTPQKVEQVVADEQRFSAQLATREADLEQAKAMLQSNEPAAEAERRIKAVLESQDLQLIADLHARAVASTQGSRLRVTAA
jgi:outer membrane murein-binding lipoprotein Lpp